MSKRLTKLVKNWILADYRSRFSGNTDTMMYNLDLKIEIERQMRIEVAGCEELHEAGERFSPAKSTKKLEFEETLF